MTRPDTAAEWKCLAKRLASDALVALAGAVATPEEGYIKAPHCLQSDIQALRVLAYPRWIQYTERLPENSDYPVWMTNGKEVAIAFDAHDTSDLIGKPFSFKRSSAFDRTCFAWMPIRKPLPPKQ